MSDRRPASRRDRHVSSASSDPNSLIRSALGHQLLAIRPDQVGDGQRPHDSALVVEDGNPRLRRLGEALECHVESTDRRDRGAPESTRSPTVCLPPADILERRSGNGSFESPVLVDHRSSAETRLVK